MKIDVLKGVLKIIAVLFFLYLFLVSIGLMSAAFKGFGEDFASNLIRTTSNPLAGLFIGILVTSIVQSSSTTTSIVIGMVGGGVVTLNNAIPIIMGANIGTTVTGILVSLGYIGRREEFKRAIAGGTLDGFFKILCVLILFPIELSTGFLSKAALYMSGIFANIGGIKFTSPIKLATDPAVFSIENVFIKTGLPQNIVYVLLLLLSLIFLFLSLCFIVSGMRSLVIKKAEIVLNNVIGRYGFATIFAACIFTAVIQSSSITIALMIPLVAAGVLDIRAMYPIVIGANIGTTVTAMLASFATGNIVAVSAAFVHFLFNMISLIFIYPCKSLREIPLFLAKGLGELTLKRRRIAILYTVVVFFVIPLAVIVISKFLNMKGG
jgi:solute carrier family 34 (sodium-dependent phosphate cotransporter)